MIKSLKITDSKLGMLSVVKGDKNIFAETLVQLNGPEGGQKTADQKSFTELTIKLSLKRSNLYEFTPEDLKEHLAALRDENVLLISCADEVIANAAAYAVADQFHFSDDEQRRHLDFARAQTRDLNIYSLLNRKSDALPQVVLLADAISSNALMFLDSLLNATVSEATHIKDGLRDDGTFLICLVDPRYIESRSKSERGPLKFPHWQVSFLRSLLKQRYRDSYLRLEEQILLQRKRGVWSGDEAIFCEKLKAYLDSGPSPAEIESYGPQAQPDVPDIQTYLDSIFEGDNPISETILYVATFFHGLNPNEFSRVVASLLSTRSTKAVITYKETKKGKRKPILIEEKNYVQLWTASPERLIRDCHLRIDTRDSTRFVAFSDSARRESVKAYLDERGLYLENRFNTIQKLGLLFDPSESVADRVISLAVSLASIYPEFYVKNWILETIEQIEQGNAPAAFAHDTQGEPGRQLSLMTAAGKAKERSYMRLLKLIRAMLGVNELVEPVKELMNYLLANGHHKSLLTIIKGLSYAHNFKEIHWLKQLLDQGDKSIRVETYRHLYGRVKEKGKQIYEMLDLLESESWLPEINRDIEAYSFSNRFALGLMLEYCLEVTSKFDSKRYGIWPTDYQFLAMEGKEAAGKNLASLIKWLFHPGMSGAFTDEGLVEMPSDLLNALVTEWIFILLGQLVPVEENNSALASTSTEGPATQSVCPQPEAEPGPASESQPDAGAVLKSLLQHIIVYTNASKQSYIQDDLIEYWERLKSFSENIINFIGYSNIHQRREYVWRRNLIREALIQFRTLQRELKS